MSETVNLARTLRGRLSAAVAGATLLGFVAVALSGPSAVAGPQPDAESTDTGYGASIEVTFEGPVHPGRAASVSRIPPFCWWKKVEASSPEEFTEWFWEQAGTYGPSSAGGGPWFLSQLGSSTDILKEVEERFKNGEKLSWYELQFAYMTENGTGYQRTDETHKRLTDLGCTTVNGSNSMTGSYPVRLRAFEDGNPPAPRVDPEELAEAAYKAAAIEEPTLEWNPRIKARGSAALLNVPTWVWVDDPNAVDEMEVTARAAGEWSRVTAHSGGLSVSSPAGGTECSVDQAQVKYAKGVDPSTACTLSFARASYGYDGGFPVSARAAWSATWTSSTGEGGTLADRDVSGTTLIPVAGSQAMVTRVR